MSKPLVFLSCGLLLLLTGCWLGDRFFTARTVAVNFPALAGQNNVALSVDDTCYAPFSHHKVCRFVV